MQLPSIPHGQTTNTTSLGVLRERTCLRHEDDKPTLLAKLRAIAEPPVAGRANPAAAPGAIATRLIEHRERMAAIRLQIAEAEGRLSSMGVAPAARSAMAGVVKFLAEVPRIALSLPKTELPIEGAMKVPRRQGQPKASSNRRSPQALLGNESMQRRVLDAMIDNGAYLSRLEQEGEQLGEQLEAGLNQSLAVLIPLSEELSAALANVEGSRSAPPHAAAAGESGADAAAQLGALLERIRNGAGMVPAGALPEAVLALVAPHDGAGPALFAGEPLLAAARQVHALLQAEMAQIRTLLNGGAQRQPARAGEALLDKLRQRRANLGASEAAAGGASAPSDALARFVRASAADGMLLDARFDSLAGRLQQQAAPRGDQLDNAAVSQLVRRALAAVVPDAAGAAAALDALCDTLTPQLVGETAFDSPVRRVASAIAVLPCGIEILKRLLSDVATVPANHREQLDALGRDEALLVYLRAAKAQTELGQTCNPSTARLLGGALAAARTLAGNPGAQVSGEQLAAYRAVRSGLLHSGAGSQIAFIGARLEKARGQWITRATERAGRLFGRVGQGSKTGVASVLNLLPSTGKTPFGERMLAASEKTSTSYGVDPALTGARMDEHIKDAVAGLRSGVVAMLTDAAVSPENMRALLLRVAAADVAMDQASEGLVRPEHCSVGGAAVGARLGILLAEAGTGDLTASPVPALPDSAVLPLKSEHLIGLKRDLLALTGAHFVQAASDEFQAALRAIDKLEKIIDTSPPPPITSPEDLHRYLSIRLEQLELRGKFRWTSGGVMGLSTRSLSEAISENGWLVGLGVTPKLTVEALGGRTAVFEVSLGSLGFELLIGTESRKSGTGGAGVAAGAGESLAKAGAGVDWGANIDNIVLDGVKFTIPRSRTGAYTDEQMREEGQRLLKALLLTPLGGETMGMPGSLAAILEACPHVSVVRSDIWSDRVLTQDTAGTVSLSSKPKVGDDGQSAGGGLSATVKNTRLLSRKFQQSDRSGYFRIERHNYGYGGWRSLRLGAGLSATLDRTGDPVQVSTVLGASGVSRTMTLDLQGGDVKVRIVTEHGRLQTANTRRDLEFNRVAAILAKLESDRETWLQLGVQERFKDDKYAGMPLEEKRRLAGISLDEMQKACLDAERGEDGTTVLRNVFGLSFKMVDDAASQFNYLLAQEALVDAEIDKLKQGAAPAAQGRRAFPLRWPGRRTGAHEKLAVLVNEKIMLLDTKDALLREDSTWKAWRFTSSERTLQRSLDGVDLLVKGGALDIADGQRPIKSWPV